MRFLSRLCGGEGVDAYRGFRNPFLSRLCGGEAGVISLIKHLHFLSRLCGGEVISLLFRHGQTFLSRLCGGEGPYEQATGYLDFLSRLCGGEEEFYPKKSSYSEAYQVKIPFLPYIFCLDITD